jgi:hypothetical protein
MGRSEMAAAWVAHERDRMMSAAKE